MRSKEDEPNNAAHRHRAARTDEEAAEVDRQEFSIVHRAIERTRLMIEGSTIVSTADVTGKLTAAFTEFGKGNFGIALSLVQTAAGLYQEKLNRWERLVEQREAAVKQRSMQKFRYVQSVHNPIRINSRQIPSRFRHLTDKLAERVRSENASSDHG